jgi:hypothetical protein
LSIKGSPGEVSAQGIALVVDGNLAAHVFDIEGGIAFIAHGWADSIYGSGQPCHFLHGDFQPYDTTTWIALNTEYGDIVIRVHEGPEEPDGPREKAKEVLEQSLQITIP